jgi:lycopene cyclase domain-containing protein
MGLMDRFQYLIVLGACLAVTAPLELLGARVYRRPVRLARAVLPVAFVFAVWDVVAVAAHVWGYNARYVTGWRLPFGLPVEEALFFLVIPLCAVLTYECVRVLSERFRPARQEGR